MRSFTLLCCLCAWLPAQAEVSKNLLYPNQTPDADEIMAQAYFVEQLYVLENLTLSADAPPQLLLHREAGGEIQQTQFKRELNNAYENGKVRARDLWQLTAESWEQHGLVTDFVDAQKSPVYEFVTPKAPRVQREVITYAKSWAGSVLTWGDRWRKPEQARHQFLGNFAFFKCLDRPADPATWAKAAGRSVPEEYCQPRNQTLYQVQSTPHVSQADYDDRISYIDQHTFVTYRIDFFKDGQRIRRLDRAWEPLPVYQGKDPRAQYAAYWYVRDEVSGAETWLLVPGEGLRINQALKSSHWSVRQLD